VGLIQVQLAVRMHTLAGGCRRNLSVSERA